MWPFTLILSTDSYQEDEGAGLAEDCGYQGDENADKGGPDCGYQGDENVDKGGPTAHQGTDTINN